MEIGKLVSERIEHDWQPMSVLRIGEEQNPNLSRQNLSDFRVDDSGAQL